MSAVEFQKVTKKIKITGRVQGVFYRVSARAMSRTLGLSGFARNEPDGSVLIEVSGDENLVGEFINWCAKGPEMAQVDEVIVNEIENKKYQGFRIQ